MCAVRIDTRVRFLSFPTHLSSSVPPLPFLRVSPSSSTLLPIRPSFFLFVYIRFIPSRLRFPRFPFFLYLSSPSYPSVSFLQPPLCSSIPRRVFFVFFRLSLSPSLPTPLSLSLSLLFVFDASLYAQTEASKRIARWDGGRQGQAATKRQDRWRDRRGGGISATDRGHRVREEKGETEIGRASGRKKEKRVIRERKMRLPR